MHRGKSEFVEVFRGMSCPVSSTTRFSTQFPLGEKWVRMLLNFHITLTVGTGTGALAEGELRVIRGITFRTDRGELICNGVPGRLLYRIDQIKSKTAGAKDAIAAASATYDVAIPIWFKDPDMRDPYQFLLDTARYGAVNLEVQIGSVADLLGVVGTASVVVTVDCAVERMLGKFEANQQVSVFKEYGIRAPVDPTSLQTIEYERTQGFALQRIGIFTTTGSSSGVPFSGDASNAVIADLTFDDGALPFNRLLEKTIRNDVKARYQMESATSGFYLHDFCADNIASSANYTGNKSRSGWRWTNGTLPATPQVTGWYEGFRPLF